MFNGYSGETLDFMWGIRFNNDRAWFAEHKDTYLRVLYQPTLDLGRAVYDRMLERFPGLDVNLHVSRIYRDARRLHGRALQGPPVVQHPSGGGRVEPPTGVLV